MRRKVWDGNRGLAKNAAVAEGTGGRLRRGTPQGD